MYPLAKIWFMTEAGYDYDKKKTTTYEQEKEGWLRVVCLGLTHGL